ncbi:MAG: ATP-binding protein [Bacteroidaceae bacterium]|nr:ATP-binding protein [Bacteroidaceae bacterium]
MNKEIIIKNEIAELERVAVFVEEVSQLLSLDSETTMNLNLALEEVVSNVILYAYPQKMGENIIIKASSDDNILVFTITDKGDEFDPTKVEDADITLAAEDREIGGLGIFIVKNIMNEVTYQRLDGKNILTLKKNIHN